MSAGEKDFVLENDTGKVIKRIHIGPFGLDQWGDNLIAKGAVVSIGGNVHISFPLKVTAHKWDMRIVFEDDSWNVWHESDDDATTIVKIQIFYLKNGDPFAENQCLWKK
jgi:hypothetical protein